MDWMARDGAAAGAPLRGALGSVRRALAGGPQASAALRTKLRDPALAAWDEAYKADWAARAAVPGKVAAAYAAFAPTAADDSPEPGFPRRMPYYYRHTSLFRAHAHARALMRLRCCSDPFAASPTLHYDASPGCMRCAAAPPETAEHALLDCRSFSRLRAEPRFAALFASPLPPGERLRAFVRLPDQFALAEFVHTCFEDRSMSQ